MSTASWSTRVRHDSDATFQEWRDEFITKVGTMTLMVANETNITPGAGARPGANTEQGYAVYHLNDSLHGTSPIYIRFGFGTNSGTTGPRIQVTVGTSTNGSGVLGGTALSTINTVGANAAQATDTARQSYMSCVAGFFGFDWKVGASVTESCFLLARGVDTAGAIAATGAVIVVGKGAGVSSPNTQAFRFPATAAAYTAQVSVPDTALCFNPQSRTTSAVGSDIQALICFIPTPGIVPIAGMVGVWDAEVSGGSTFTCTPVGTTSRTYIGLASTSCPAGIVLSTTANGGVKYAMLWE